MPGPSLPSLAWYPTVSKAISESWKSPGASAAQNSVFISIDRLQDIWNQPLPPALSRSRLRSSATVSALECLVQEFPCLNNTSAAARWLRIVSILIRCYGKDPEAWTDLQRVIRTSWDSIQVEDERLPFTLEDLQHHVFPQSSEHADIFRDYQYRFCPLILEQDKHLRRSGELSLYRLPIIELPESAREGAYGTVTKVKIVKNHFRYKLPESHGSTYLNNEDITVARKKFDDPDNYWHEVRQLQNFASSEIKHNRIMTCLGSVLLGTQGNIFFRWADWDLEQFMKGNYPAGLNNDLITPRALFKEAAGLAGALETLHTQFWRDGKPVSCCHMDIKPSNILVMPDFESRIGKWTITDFGISSVVSQTDVLSPLDHSTTTRAIRATGLKNEPKLYRYPGPFQPPEAEPTVLEQRKAEMKKTPGEKSDVWSFGCVLLNVLAFSIGGPPLFRLLFDILQQKGVDEDGVNRSSRYYRLINGKFQVDPKLIQQLDRMMDVAPWSRDLLTLVLGKPASTAHGSPQIPGMMEIEPVDRQDTRKMREHLGRIATAPAIPGHNIWEGRLDEINYREPVLIPRISNQSPPAPATGLSATTSQGSSSNMSVRSGTSCSVRGSSPDFRGYHICLSDGADHMALWNEDTTASLLTHDSAGQFGLADGFKHFDGPWSTIRLSGDFAALHNNATGIFRLTHFNNDNHIYKEDWTTTATAQLLGFDLAADGRLAFRFRDRVAIYASDGTIQHQIFIKGEPILAMTFYGPPTSLFVLSQSKWILCKAKDDGSFARSDSFDHKFLPQEHGRCDPELLALPSRPGSPGFILHPNHSQNPRRLIYQTLVGSQPGISFHFNIENTSGKMCVSPDRAFYLVAFVEKSGGHFRVRIRVHDIREESQKITFRREIELETLKVKAKKLATRKPEVAITAVRTRDCSTMAVVATSAGGVEWSLIT